MAIGRGEQEVVEVRSGDVETLLQDSAWFRTRRRKVRVVFGAFVAVALSAVAVAMLGDSWGLPDSQSNVLAQTRVEMEKMSRTQITMALAANSALHLKKRFISLAENSTESGAADSNSTAAAAVPAAAGSEEKTTDSEEKPAGTGNKTDTEHKEDTVNKQDVNAPKIDPHRPPYSRPDDSMRPGWGDKSGWDASDWAVWIICGPILTLAACMFVFYSYGWGWAAGTFVALVTVDIFAYYYNI